MPGLLFADLGGFFELDFDFDLSSSEAVEELLLPRAPLREPCLPEDTCDARLKKICSKFLKILVEVIIITSEVSS